MSRAALETSHRVEPVAPREAPGLDAQSRRFQSGELVLPTATSPWRALPARLGETGAAWGDPEFARELMDLHGRLGAGPGTQRHLEALREGRATCVVTGQQPGLLGGPLFCAYKIAGAVGLARELTTRTGRTVVPVYWCGADDSDFEEVRRAWFWSNGAQAFRGELPEDLWRDGQRVGSVEGTRIAEVERAVLGHAGDAPGSTYLRSLLGELPGDFDLASRVMGFFLRVFGDAGLVVVDARSARLRALGRPWFEQYAQQHEVITAAVATRSRELAAQGLATPLGDGALQSGLFALEDDLRRKIEPAELRGELPGDIAPSVLLRPVWQDALLAPAAAVLGPSELSYHAQLAPLYAALRVTAAAPVARPHLTLLPAGLPWPSSPDRREALLAGGEPARAVLADAAFPPGWTRALEAGRESTLQAWSILQDALDPASRRTVEAWPARSLAEWDRLHESLRAPALALRAAEAPAWEFAPRWLAVRGTPQERAFAATVGWWRWGRRFTATLETLGQRYAKAVSSGAPTTFVGREDA